MGSNVNVTGEGGVIIAAVQKERIGCIGISGYSELTRPLQKLAAIIFQEDLAKRRSKGTRK